MQLCNRPLTALVLLAASLGLMQQAARAEESVKVYQTVLKATTWIKTPHGTGTGWVADRTNRLIVTNYHVVETNATVDVVFPAYRDGKVIAERDYYAASVTPLKGQVVTTMPGYDLAVVQVDALPAGVTELKLAGEIPDPGDIVHTVGNPGVSGGLWVYSFGSVRSLYRESRLSADPLFKGRVVETQVPINPGDSGSALVNGRAEVVGVNFYHRQGDLVTLAIDVREVKDLLAQTKREIAPASAEDFVLRADKRVSQGRLDDAVKDYSTAIDKNPKLADAYLSRAWVYNDTKKYAEAIADCESALKLKPNTLNAYRERGYAHMELANVPGAVSDFTEGLRLEPGNRTLLNYRGKAYLMQKEYDKALDDFSEAMEPAEKSAGLFNNRGEAYLGLGKYNLALKDLNQAIVINPNYADAYAKRAEVYLGQKKYDKALSDVGRAIDLQPDNADYYKVRAKVYEAMGKDAQADSDRAEARRLAGR
jgi:tetratricopeptide (TPR) repeat protein